MVFFWWCFCFGVVVFLCLCFCGGVRVDLRRITEKLCKEC